MRRMNIRVVLAIFSGLATMGMGTPIFGQGPTQAQSASRTTSIPQKPLTEEQQLQQQHLQLLHLVEQLTPYRPGKELSGKVKLRGSSALLDIGHTWAENFKEFHPKVEFDGSADGSEAGLKELANDPKVVAGISRPVDKEDEKLLLSGKCKSPLAICVATSAMAVFVHKDNPIAGLSPEQIQAIYEAGPDGTPIAKTWGDVGVTGPMAKQPIRVYQREESSGTNVFIQRTVLNGKPMANAKKPMASNEEVLSSIQKDPTGIGIGDMSNHMTGLHRVSLVIDGKTIEANESSVLQGKYPLMRPLLLVVEKDQLASDGGIREAILRYVLSKDGQTEAMKSGYYPLNPSFIRQQLDAISGQQIR